MEYVVTFLIVGGIIGFFTIWAVKENKEQKALVEKLTSVQIAQLQCNDVQDYDTKNNTWTQKGIIARVIDKNSKYELKILWFNTIINNNTYNDFQLAEISMKKTEFNEKGLSEGSYIRFYIDPHKAKVEILSEC